MKKADQLLIILPCHSLEDFPTHHRGADAADLLSKWTGLWHPGFISSAQAIPDWIRADTSEMRVEIEEGASAIVAIPSVSDHSLDADLVGLLHAKKCHLVSAQMDRDGFWRRFLEEPDLLNCESKAASDPSFDIRFELVDDFFALGYAFLQVQLMTRQLRYSSNLDLVGFQRMVVEAADHSARCQRDETRASLQRCFDMLLEEKNSYYPVDPDLMDVVLTAPSTLGQSLREQLSEEHPLNIHLTGQLIEQLARDNPEAMSALKTSVASGKVCLTGGLQEELPSNLTASETLVNQINRGRKTFEHHFGIAPTVFMRRRFGLHPSTPGILDQMEFSGVIHANFEDGKFPKASSCNVRWTGEDDQSILAIGDVPMDAADSGSFLGFGVRLGEAIDSAHVASVLLVHWPNRSCQSFQDIIRVSNYGPIFGHFKSLDDYFDNIYDPGYGETYTSDEYRPPFFQRSIAEQQAQPISRFTTYWNRHYRIQACRALLVQVCARTKIASEDVKRYQNDLGELQSQVESELNKLPEHSDLDSELQKLESEIQDRLAAIGSELSRDSKTQGQLVVNPHSFQQRVSFQTDDQNKQAKHQPPVVYADSYDRGTVWVVDIAGSGISEINVSKKDASAFQRDPQPAKKFELQNEFFQLDIDQKTGGIRGIQLHGQRTNLCGQQLSMRIPETDRPQEGRLNKARYAEMVSDSIETFNESRLVGKITSRGRLMDGSSEVGSFQQQVSLTRGLKYAEVHVKVEPSVPLQSSQNNYVCSRLAWKDESTRVIANQNESRYDVTSDWFHATHFFEILQAENKVTFLTGGLPYHRRVSRRMIDTILVCGCESTKEFSFRIGIDLPYSYAAAVDMMSPVIQIPGPVSGSADATSWLFHLNCKNVIATYWEPLQQDGRWAGVTIRLRETEGRGGKLRISCPHPIAIGQKCNFVGSFICSLEVRDEDPSQIEIDFGRFEFFEITLNWKT